MDEHAVLRAKRVRVYLTVWRFDGREWGLMDRRCLNVEWY